MEMFSIYRRWTSRGIASISSGISGGGTDSILWDCPNKGPANKTNTINEQWNRLECIDCFDGGPPFSVQLSVQPLSIMTSDRDPPDLSLTYKHHRNGKSNLTTANPFQSGIDADTALGPL